MASIHEVRERQLGAVQAWLAQLSGSDACDEPAETQVREILEIGREVLITNRLRESATLVFQGEVPNWLRAALVVMVTELACAVATEVLDGGPTLAAGHSLFGKMTEGLDRDPGAHDRGDSRLRLIVRERTGRRFTLTLINYGRNVAVALTAHASPGLLRWDIVAAQEQYEPDTADLGAE